MGSTGRRRSSQAKQRAGGLPERERVLALRRALQDRVSVEATCISVDGRRFEYDAPLTAGLAVGSFVKIETAAGRFLGQITRHEAGTREGAELSLELGTDLGEYVEGATLSKAGLRLQVKHAAGSGTLLAKFAGKSVSRPDYRDAFESGSIAVADGKLVTRYMDAFSGHRARLTIGTVERCEGTAAAYLRADGFDRHTFHCGQSGSGKTYSLGVILEQLLARTKLRLIIIDPNSDFVRMASIRSGSGAQSAYQRQAKRLLVLRPAAQAEQGGQALRLWFSDLTVDEQAAVLQLDPLRDREEYNELATITATFDGRRYSLADVREAARDLLSGQGRQLVLRIDNLRVADWAIWAHGDQASSADAIREDTRGLIVDVGSLPSVAEKSAAAAAVLGALWRSRDRREPILVVIDEAHNVCPAEPSGALQAKAAEYCINIAAEGRKYGRYLLLATQRPQKLHRNVLSQCDNLVLMRMNSRADLQDLSEVFSFVPANLLEEASRFQQGEALLAGKIVPSPLIARFGRRISEEGGADVATDWADVSRALRTSRRK